MKCMLVILIASVATAAANADGLFRFAVFSGEQNYSSDVWNSQTIVDSLSVMYSNGNGSDRTTFAYATYMRFLANKRYMFRGSWDDHAAMKIDGRLVFKTQSLNEVGTYSITFPCDGYHRVELFVSNGGGWYGYDPIAPAMNYIDSAA